MLYIILICPKNIKYLIQGFDCSLKGRFQVFMLLFSQVGAMVFFCKVMASPGKKIIMIRFPTVEIDVFKYHKTIWVRINAESLAENSIIRRKYFASKP